MGAQQLTFHEVALKNESGDRVPASAEEERVDWSWTVEIGSWSFGGGVKKREEQRSITAITECALRDWLETRGLVW